MDILQLILTIVLILLAVNLLVITVFVILILKDFRSTLKKANGVLDNVHNLASPATTLAGILAGVTQSVKAVKSISELFDLKKKDN